MPKLRYIMMADPEPTPEGGEGGTKMKDPFLDKLIKIFGKDKGLDIFQSDSVTEEDINSLEGILQKIGYDAGIFANDEEDAVAVVDEDESAKMEQPVEEKTEGEKKDEVQLSQLVSKLIGKVDKLTERVVKSEQTAKSVMMGLNKNVRIPAVVSHKPVMGINNVLNSARQNAPKVSKTTV